MAKIKYAAEENWPWHGNAEIIKIDHSSYLASANAYNTWTSSTMTMSLHFDSKDEAKNAVKNFFAVVSIPEPVWY